MPNFTPSTFRARLKQFVGLPYVLGAEFDSTFPSSAIPKALDCSELVETACRENGTPIGDLAASQYDKTVSVRPGDERVGDLVFLANNAARWNKIGHVAILTAPLPNGDWEIIEARGTKAGVVETTLSYWKARRYYTGEVRRFPGFSLLPEPVVVKPLNATTTTLPLLKVTKPLMNSELIRKLQRFALENFSSYANSTIGKAGGADGLYGAGTREWVAEFQGRVGLTRDGEVGPHTWAKLVTHGFKP